MRDIKASIAGEPAGGEGVKKLKSTSSTRDFPTHVTWTRDRPISKNELLNLDATISAIEVNLVTLGM